MPSSRPITLAVWPALAIAALMLLVAVGSFDRTTPAAHAANAELLFSEYVEGTGINKALELFNDTSVPVVLDGVYDIQLFANGSSTPTATIALAGTVATGGAFVLARAGADPDLVARADQTTSNFLFNGNDAVVLRRAGVPIDVVGQIGVDPGAAWEGADGTSTIDQTLRRRTEVGSGDRDGSDVFDPSLEWDSFPANAFDGLGAHEAGGQQNQPPIAGADSAESRGTPISIDVLANDSDPDDDPLTLLSVNVPSVGSTRIGDDGRTVEYTPPSSAWERASFTYELSDSASATAIGTVEVTFRADPDPDPTDPCLGPATLTGTGGNDFLRGTPGDDVIHAGAGHDLVLGLGGDDILCDGPGFDVLLGGDGADVLVDADGSTFAAGGHGDDRITTGPGRDRVWGGSGDDAIATGAGNDGVHGGTGDDVIDVSTGYDCVNGGRGIDTCVAETHDRVWGCE